MGAMTTACTPLPQPPRSYSTRYNFTFYPGIGDHAPNHPTVCVGDASAYACRVVFDNPAFGDGGHAAFVLPKNSGVSVGGTDMGAYGQMFRANTGTTYEGCWDGSDPGAVGSDPANFYCEYLTEDYFHYKPSTASDYFFDVLWHWEKYTIWQVGGCVVGVASIMTGSAGFSTLLGTTCIEKPFKP